MVSSLPQRSGYLRVRYRALLLDAWGRPAAAAKPAASERPASAAVAGNRRTRSGGLVIGPLPVPPASD